MVEILTKREIDQCDADPLCMQAIAKNTHTCERCEIDSIMLNFEVNKCFHL